MDKDLAYLVSNIDLQKKFKITPDQIMIKIYPDLNDVEDIMNILPSEICVCFILLKTSEQSGHWTCLVRNNNLIYYFDSYGVAPDGELSKISPGIRYELHENPRALTGGLERFQVVIHSVTIANNSNSAVRVSTHAANSVKCLPSAYSKD